VKNVAVYFFENNVKNRVFHKKFVSRLIFHGDHEFVISFKPRKLIYDAIKISYDHNSLSLKVRGQNLSEEHFAQLPHFFLRRDIDDLHILLEMLEVAL